jgi:hypothetical protein
VLDAMPHFNHISDVLQAVVPRMGCPDERMRTESCESISLLLARGQQEEVMVEAVQLVADMVRANKCRCQADAVRALFSLEFANLTREDIGQGELHCHSVLAHVLIAAYICACCIGHQGKGIVLTALFHGNRSSQVHQASPLCSQA